ncbi:MAG TPA: class E sortase [Acidimicrobiales bacterium]
MTGLLRTGRRKLGAAVVALAICAGAGGWALTNDGSPDRSAADDPIPAAAAAPAESQSDATTTTAPTTTTTAPVQLPVPEPVPADPRAPTPEIVHGTLALPTIGVEQPLHEGATLTAIDRGPSHWPGTAMPGQVGNVVVAGHRVTHTRPFYDLDRLEPGDPLVFTMNDGTTWTYELERTEIVEPDALWIIDQTPERTATLFACHPKHSAAQRIVAHFRLVEG